MTGHRPFKELAKGLPAARKARIADKTAALNTALALHELRKVRTVSQRELADRLAVGQPAVAKLERRGDMYVSNLRRYVEALGGTLEIAARFPDGAVTIAPEVTMKATDEASLHRKRPGSATDKMITEGPKLEVLKKFNNVPPSQRSQYSMMMGNVVFNHLEIENMVREANLEDEDS
ncbi:MAG: XRE family transcriptional regulator [Pseudolabrys sp.]|nr:XRE family transcriptional regulator [Pseudolabrys sp.]